MQTGMAKDAHGSDIVDCSYLSDLIEAIGEDDYRALMESFETDADNLLRALEQSAGEGDMAATKAIAHRLAGLLSQFGAFDALTIGEQIREARDLDAAVEHVSAMARLCRASAAVVLTLCNGRSAQ